MGLLPDKVPEVLRFLKGQPATNSRYLCPEIDQLKQTYNDICQPVITKRVAVVLNENNNNLYIFVNPQWIDTRTHNRPRLLPDSTAGASWFSDHEISSSWSQRGGRREHSSEWQQHAMFSHGNTHLDADISRKWQGTGPSPWRVYDIQLTHRKDGRYYQAGTLAAVTNNNLPQPGFLGLAIGRDQATADISASQGSPQILSLDSPSEVVIRRHGDQRLLYKKTLFPGIQQLNTRSFPEGIYRIDITITSTVNEQKRQLTRLYIKRSSIPLSGYPYYDFGAGWLHAEQKPDEARRIQLPAYHFGVPALFARVHRALNYRSALAASLLAYENGTVGSMTGDLYTNTGIASLSLTASSGGSAGAGSTLSWALPRLGMTFGTHLARTWQGKDRFLKDDYQWQQDIQISGSWHDYQLSASLGWFGSRDTPSQLSYFVSMGRALRYAITDHSSLSLSFRAGHDDRGLSGGLSLALGYRHHTHQAGLRLRSPLPLVNSPEKVTQDWEGQAYGSTEQKFGQGRLSAHSNMAFEPEQDPSVSGHLSWRHPKLEAQASLSSSSDRIRSTALTQFSLAGSGTHATLSSQARLNAGLLVDVRAAGAENFHVMVDGRPYASGKAGQPLFVGLPPYRTYEVAVLALSSRYIVSQQSSRVTLYPGNVQRIRRDMVRNRIYITHLVNKEGLPWPNASRVDEQGGLASSDDKGFIQFSALENEKQLSFRTGPGTSCRLDLPPHQGKNLVYRKSMLCHTVTTTSPGAHLKPGTQSSPPDLPGAG